MTAVLYENQHEGLRNEDSNVIRQEHDKMRQELDIIRQEHDMILQQQKLVQQEQKIPDMAFQALIDSYNLSVTSINRFGQQVITSTKSMSEAILDRIRAFGDTIAKQTSTQSVRKVENAMIGDVHMKLFNTLRKESPEKYKEMVSITKLILDKPLEVQLATIAYYFGEPEAVKIVDTLRRIEIQKKLKSLQQSNKPIPKELEPYLKDPVDMNNPPTNLSLTNLQYHVPVAQSQARTPEAPTASRSVGGT